MPRLRFRISISLDGFVAGPNQSVDQPLGVGGMRLHEWIFPLAAWRQMHGMEGGVEGPSTEVVKGWMTNIGATIMGRNMFGGHPGPWNGAEPWQGWWGEEPPFHHPVFVVTHHARAPLTLGETTFHFVTDGIESALAKARLAAGNRDISLGGGADVARQYLRSGLVDEMWLSVVPTLLGAGERLLEGITDEMHGLTLARTVGTPDVVHMQFARP